MSFRGVTRRGISQWQDQHEIPRLHCIAARNDTPAHFRGRNTGAGIFPRCLTSISFLFLLLGAVLVFVPLAWGAEPSGEHDTFRVCADPNNLPFSNQQRQGFENKLAELLARELKRELHYTWWPQRRGFFRNTLDAGACDVVMGVPAGFAPVLTTQPYYRSAYVFVHAQQAPYHIASFDAPELRRLKIGVHLIGDDYMNSPPAHVLAAKGIVRNVVGYSVFGNYAEDSPPGKIIHAVASGEIDVAIVWGPIAGYFARQQTPPLTLILVPTEETAPALPLVYSMALGVRRQDVTFKNQLDALLQRKANDIHALLAHYGVPLLSQ